MDYYNRHHATVLAEKQLTGRGLPLHDEGALRIAGFYPVTERKPELNPLLYTVGQAELQINETAGICVRQFAAVPLPMPIARAGLKTQIAAQRYEAEMNGVTLPDGTRLPTDVEARIRFNTALSGCPADGTVSVKIDGTFRTLTHVEMTELVKAIATHVQTCFDHERNLHELIDAAETVAELETIDSNNVLNEQHTR